MPDPRDDIEFARLVDWVEGRLSPEESGALAEEVDERDLAWVRAFLRASGDTVIASPPAEVRDALISRFEERAEARRRPGFLERVRAVLSFDSGMQPAFGVRSADVRESQRQLVYSSETADVALDLHPGRDGTVDVVGQVLAVEEGAEPFGFQLLRDGAEAALTTTDELGMFSLSALAPGEYEAVVTGEGFEVLLSPVSIEP